MTELPPLPKIDGDFDLLLDVYTHKSLTGFGAALNEKYGNTDRLALLGREVLDLAVTYHFFAKRPCLEMDDIQRSIAAFTAPETTSGWVESYGLKEKLRVNPPQRQAVLADQDEMNTYFNTYVGAVFHQNGLQAVQDWISGLLDPGAPPPQLPQNSQMPPSMAHSGMGAFQSAPSFPSFHQGYNNPGHYGAPQPAGAPPPLPASPPPSTPMSGGSLSLVTLALVNQTAAQRGVAITYPASQEGPPHQPLWTVRCCINNVEQGIGRGKSQKLAKEEAARQAWAAMGWGPTG